MGERTEIYFFQNYLKPRLRQHEYFLDQNNILELIFIYIIGNHFG